jgi:hypothetical protein
MSGPCRHLLDTILELKRPSSAPRIGDRRDDSDCHSAALSVARHTTLGQFLTMMCGWFINKRLFNRRMGKTARPVVWEDDGAQSPSLDLIQEDSILQIMRDRPPGLSEWSEAHEQS